MERRCALPQTWFARERECSVLRSFGWDLCTSQIRERYMPTRSEKYTHPLTTTDRPTRRPYWIIAHNPLATSTTPTGPNTPNTPKSVQIRLPLKRRCISRSFRSSNSSRSRSEPVSGPLGSGSAERRMRRGLRR